MTVPTFTKAAYVPQPKFNELVSTIQEIAEYAADEMALAEFPTEKDAQAFLSNLQRAAQENFEKGTVTVKKSLVSVADKKGEFQTLEDGGYVDTGWTRGIVQRKNRETKTVEDVDGYTFSGGKTVLGVRVVTKEPGTK